MPKLEAWLPEKVRPGKNIREVKLDEALALLGESMRIRQLQPIGVIADGELLWGFRRLAAALHVKLPTIDVVVFDTRPTDAELNCWRLDENHHRQDMTPWEMTVAYYELLQNNPTLKMSDLAARLSVSPARVTQVLAPMKCIVPVQHALRDGLISGMDAYRLSQRPAEEQQGLLNLLLSQKEEPKPRQKTSVRTARVKFPAANATVTVAGEELDLEEYTQALEAALSAARKATKDNLDIRTAERVWRDKAGAS
jgi:ParB/RepB/Spo0J family partition protein